MGAVPQGGAVRHQKGARGCLVLGSLLARVHARLKLPSDEGRAGVPEHLIQQQYNASHITPHHKPTSRKPREVDGHPLAEGYPVVRHTHAHQDARRRLRRQGHAASVDAADVILHLLAGYVVVVVGGGGGSELWVLRRSC